VNLPANKVPPSYWGLHWDQFHARWNIEQGLAFVDGRAQRHMVAGGGILLGRSV
jgi:hypothetical protein